MDISDTEAAQPNVIVIMTDDLGYGDLGCHGNTVVETPTLDGLYDESTRFTRFYDGPVCSPSRASLMTGRYHYRIGVTDTFKGRSMMHPDEVTLAECLGDAGYRTGIFGKWHLGDNYPMRPTDQGFEETLVHRGGGLCQPAGEPDETYFDPVLYRNGNPIETAGYCTDVYTDAAIDFIESDDDRSFFAYLATNAPHLPLHVPEEYAAPYRNRGVADEHARFYGMVTNIDDNVTRVLNSLDRAGITEDTIVVFTSDHGPELSIGPGPRYNAGLRGGKSEVYEGGIRVPFFVRWPGVAPASSDRDRLAHGIDVLPTLLDACGGEVPTDRVIDGESLLDSLSEQRDASDRTLFLQCHRGDEPELYRNCAVVEKQFKLVNGRELYDIDSDPGEQRNIAAEHPEEMTRLREAYEQWFRDVSATRGDEPPRIVIGTLHENPTRLTRQEAQFTRAGSSVRSETAFPYWLLETPEARTFDVTVRFRSRDTETATAHLRFGSEHRKQSVAQWQSECVFEDVSIHAGEIQLDARIETNGCRYGIRYAEILRTDL